MAGPHCRVLGCRFGERYTDDIDRDDTDETVQKVKKGTAIRNVIGAKTLAELDAGRAPLRHTCYEM